MGKKLLKYRVNLADGTSMIVEASNIHNAISLARGMMGQLPNDINKKVVTKITSIIDNEIQDLVNLKNSIQTDARELDWTTIYNRIKNFVETINAPESNIQKLNETSGSLVKVNKENR